MSSLYSPTPLTAYKLKSGEKHLYSFAVLPWVFRTKGVFIKTEMFEPEGTEYGGHLTNKHFILEPVRMTAFQEGAAKALISIVKATVGSAGGAAWSREQSQIMQNAKRKLESMPPYIALPLEFIQRFDAWEQGYNKAVRVVIPGISNSELFLFTAQPKDKGAFGWAKGHPIEDFCNLANPLIAKAKAERAIKRSLQAALGLGAVAVAKFIIDSLQEQNRS